MERFDFDRKIFLHPENIARLKRGERPFPVTMELDLTDVCNHRCKFCFTPKLDKEGRFTLKTDVLLKTLDELWELGTRGLSFTGGGESMLHRDFQVIVEHARGLGFDLGLMTNGSLLYYGNAKLVVDNFQWVRISMSGGTAQVYNRVQGVPHFDLVTDNVKGLVSVKEQEQSKLVVGVRMLINRVNIDTALELVRTFKNTGLDYIQFASNQFEKKDITKGRKFRHILKDIAMLKNPGTKIQASGYVKDQRPDYPQRCYAHFFQAAINAKGELLFCKNCRDSTKYRVGNINNNTVREIWDGEMVRNLEGFITPANCGLFCKNSRLNETIEDVMHPDYSIQPNFIN